MKKFLFIIYLTSFHLFGADELIKHLEIEDRGGLESILKKRYLRVLTTKNAYDYYVYQGRKRGMQYEMVKEFTEFLNDKYTKKGELPIVFELVPVDFDQLIPMLKEGRGDFIAVGMTQTTTRKQFVNFTIPYQVVGDVIVTRIENKNKDWRKSLFHVPEESSYELQLQKVGIKTESINPNFNPADLMELISLKKYDYTLMNSFWAKTLVKTFDNIEIIKKNPFRTKVPISWAVAKRHGKLLRELNLFLPKIKKGTLKGNLFSYKYFYDVGRIQAVNSNFGKNIISDQDAFFKKYATKFKFDWRLIAALAYQESRFDQKIVNEWGAIGIMQIKQMTANEPYIKIPKIKGVENLENNIHAGVKYLNWIKNRYFDQNKEMLEVDRLRMTLASYNAGPSRVQRAIRRAKRLGLNPNVWFRNVELAMLYMGFSEPVVYVSEINKHYASFVLLGIE